MNYNKLKDLSRRTNFMTTKQIVFTDFNKAELLEKEVPNVGDNEVKVELEFSSISCGIRKSEYKSKFRRRTRSKISKSIRLFFKRNSFRGWQKRNRLKERRQSCTYVV